MKLRSPRSVIFLALTALLVSIALAKINREAPARCSPTLEAAGARCCAPGQNLIAGICQGEPLSCPENLVLQRVPDTYCEALNQRIHIEGGRLSSGGSDWENPTSTNGASATIAPFYLDSVEFTWARYRRCVTTHRCASLPDVQIETAAEPGLPLTRITPDQAEALCHSEGGRLPRGEEWQFAAAGAEGRRFPWGPSGLVCRRAAFGLVRGPCAEGGVSPDLTGSRPDGRTAAGIYDLSGNVAEWTRESTGYSARGGSYRSELASQLMSGASESAREAAPYIGFRCAYDSP